MVLYIAPLNSVHSARWIREIERQGQKVRVLSLYPPTDAIRTDFPELVSKARVFNRGPIWLRMLLAVAWILLEELPPKNIRKLRRSIIHGHTLGPHGLVASLSRRKKVLTIWGSDVDVNSKSRYLKYLIEFQIRRADVVTTDTQRYGKEYKDLLSKAKLVKLIHFGIEVEKYARKKGPEPNKLRILMTRNHYAVYDNKTAIKALVKLHRENYVDFEVIVAGAGPETEELVRTVNLEPGLDQKISFFGAYNESQLLKLLSQSNVYISCALSDAGLAASIAEAMSSELVPVVSDVADNRKWVTEEIGVIFAAADSDSLKAALKKINLSKISEMGLAAKNKILMENNIRVEMEKCKRMYSELIENS